MSDTPTDDHVIAVDAHCSCGAQLLGAWSGAEVDDWHETHIPNYETWAKETPDE